MHAGRLIFFALMLATAAGLTWLMVLVLAPGGWRLAEVLILLCFLGIVPWLGVCVGNALPGFLVLATSRNPPRMVLPVAGDIEAGPITLTTAIAVTVRNEDMAQVLPPQLALLNALDAMGLGGRFVLWILSDTPDTQAAAAESAAIHTARAALRDPARLHYRRRAQNTGFKAGNVMDFLDHHAAGIDLVLMMDADSAMTAKSALRLVRIMQADPQMGIVQHLIVGKPAAAAFPRLFQFGMRAGMRVWATGQALWQGDEGPYWGHNAILRARAFRDHCKLETLPDGSTILSHDQVEAARLRAAGWRVCVWAGEDGSQEANPPALPEFLHRDARWLAGNLQYRHLLRLPDFRPMGRWQLVQAIMMFLGAPLYVAVLALAAFLAATGGAQDVPPGPLAALAISWTLALYAPKLLGYLEVLLFPARRARYGGGWRFAAGALLEFVFMLLMDAIAQVHKTLSILRLALGRKPGWLPQNRSDRGVGWGEATRMFWPHTLAGLLAFAAFAHAGTTALLWALPFGGGLPCAIPFCVITAAPVFSAWLRRHGLAAVPEEVAAAAHAGTLSLEKS
jgi:membrane glycosyltransferase